VSIKNENKNSIKGNLILESRWTVNDGRISRRLQVWPVDCASTGYRSPWIRDNRWNKTSHL